MSLPMPYSNPTTYEGHSGVDYPQSTGTPIPASGPGVVTLTSYTARGGYWTWVKYDGYSREAGYAHQNSGNGRPSPGTRVGLGTTLGYIGSLGTNSTGPHLHLEIDGDPGTAGVYRMFNSAQSVSGGGSSSGGGFDKTVQDQQRWLISRGYDLGPSGADGIAGDFYHSAVRAYQAFLGKYGYTGDLDGQWGPGTQAAHARYWSEVNSGGGAPSNTGKLTVDGDFGPASIRALQTALGVTPDGDWGPATSRALQQKLKTIGYPIEVDGQWGPASIKALQTYLMGASAADGIEGPQTFKALQSYLNGGGKFEPKTATPEKPPVVTPPAPNNAELEKKATPNLKTPGASDFPSWIKFDVAYDPDAQSPTLNYDAQKYYGVPYNPIESHTHWWGEPGQSGTHNGNVSHLQKSTDLSTNFVTSANRITLMTPLDKIAFTTGKRNPFGWKSETDPALTEDGYKTLGFLHYIVEKLNPQLLNQRIRLHKEFMATECSRIDTAKVRKIEEQFRTGALDPETGLPPVKPNSDPKPDTVTLPRELLAGLPGELRSLAADIEKYLK